MTAQGERADEADRARGMRVAATRSMFQFAQKLAGAVETGHGSAIRVARRMACPVAFIAGISGVMLAGHENEAAACGACYANQSESTIVNDHRMALKLSQNVTVLWDQIAYSGNPTEFAYVIPARPGTRLEVSNDGWFAALDASTRPIIMSPQNGGGFGGGYGGDSRSTGGQTTGSSGGGGSGGCCAGGSDAMFAESAPAWNENGGASSAGAGGNSGPEEAAAADPVQIVSQSVVGPYETVTLRSEDPEALFEWLQANGFAIPDESKPIVEDYVTAGLDFIAMRMRPSPTQQTRAMEPIRILSPGADPTLPLRMMRIGSGANLGVTLFVIGEARYRAKTFPNVTIDASKIIWDYSKNKSNYVELSKTAMTSGDGRGWLTEYAQQPTLYLTGSVGQSGMIGNPGLADAYDTTCPSSTQYIASDASTSFDSGKSGDASSEAGASSDGGSADASTSTSDGGSSDGGSSDAGTKPDAGPPPTLPPRTRTLQCDDLDLALEDLSKPDVWVTRMRAFLPNAAMDEPLVLEPVPGNGVVDNVHYASTSGTISARIAPSKTTRGTWALVVVAAFAIRGIIRRRKREAQR
jgi:hypothetical protein